MDTDKELNYDGGRFEMRINTEDQPELTLEILTEKSDKLWDHNSEETGSPFQIIRATITEDMQAFQNFNNKMIWTGIEGMRLFWRPTEGSRDFLKIFVNGTETSVEDFEKLINMEETPERANRLQLSFQKRLFNEGLFHWLVKISHELDNTWRLCVFDPEHMRDADGYLIQYKTLSELENSLVSLLKELTENHKKEENNRES